MEKEKVSIENPATIEGITIIPLTKVSLNYWQSNGGVSFLGTKQPIAVVVVSPSAKRAFKMTGEEISLDQLLQESPAVKEALKTIKSPPPF